MKVLLIGETCFDDNCYGRCLRLNPESPTPVFSPTYSTANVGMAANVKSNLLSLSNREIQIEFVTTTERITKTRFIDEVSNYILLRVDKNDKVLPISEINLQKIEKITPDFDMVVISSYNKGFLDEVSQERIANAAIKHRVPVIMDTKTILGEWSKNVDFIKINTKEYRDNLAKIAHPENHCKTLIVTKGPEGAVIFRDGEQFDISGVKVEVSQVTGAGDSFLAGFVLEYLRTQNAFKAVIFANKVAAIAVSKRGVVAVQAEEVA